MDNRNVSTDLSKSFFNGLIVDREEQNKPSKN